MSESHHSIGWPVWGLTTAFLALAGALAIHQHTLGAFFFEDDVQWIIGGLTWPLSWLLSLEGRSHFYRPVIELYFIVQTRVWGTSPGALHATNVLLHALNGVLVFALALRILGGAVPAVVAAALFVLHPRTVEMVAWISGVTGVLMTTFVLLTLLLHLRFLRTRRRLWLVLATVACGAALLSHEAAAVLPALLLLVEWRQDRGGGDNWRRQALRTALHLAPYALLLAGFAWVSHEANRNNYVFREGHYRAGWHGLPNLAHYAVSLYVGRPTPFALLFTTLALVGTGAFAKGALRLGSLWILVTLLPYSFFLWGNTNRYLYLAAIGFCLVLAELLRRVAAWRVSGRPAGLVVAALLCVALGWRSAYFARKAARDAAARSEPYRAYAASFQSAHPHLERGAVVEVPAPGPKGPQPLYVEPLLRVVYGDPSLQVRFRGDASDVQSRDPGENVAR